MTRTPITRNRGIALPHPVAWREHRVLSATELAQVAGISKSFVGYLEKGAKKASPRTIGKLARALCITREELAHTKPPPAA